MKLSWIVLGICILIVVGLIIFIPSIKNNSNNSNNTNNKDYCVSDSDCVPDSCCHASGCVNKANAPICKNVMCTMNCEPGTLDCGGSCECINNKCIAIFGGS